MADIKIAGRIKAGAADGISGYASEILFDDAASNKTVKEKIEEAASSPQTMIVTISPDGNDGYEADKTFAEIKAFIDNGGTVIAKDEEDGDSYYYLDNYIASEVVFTRNIWGSGGFATRYYTIDNTNTVSFIDSVHHISSAVDSSSTANLANSAAVKAVKDEVDTKQNALTFDNVPTANSNNPVKSSGIKTALDAKQSTISTVNVTVDNNTGTPSGSASVSGSTLSLSFQNLKGATGATGATGPQGPQGERGLPGESGVTGDVSGFTVIQTIDPSATYGATDIAGAATVQATNQELTELAGGVAKELIQLDSYNGLDYATKRNNYYINSTDKTWSSAGTSTKAEAYTIEGDSLKDVIMLDVLCGCNGNWMMFIAFYSSASSGSTSQSTFIEEYSIQSSNTNGKGIWVSTKVPKNAKRVIISNIFGIQEQIGIRLRKSRELIDMKLSDLKSWILSESCFVQNVTYADGVVVSPVNVTWPDGNTGTLSITRDGDGLVSSVVATHDRDSYTLTIERNSDGNVINTTITKNN